MQVIESVDYIVYYVVVIDESQLALSRVQVLVFQLIRYLRKEFEKKVDPINHEFRSNQTGTLRSRRQ